MKHLAFILLFLIAEKSVQAAPIHAPVPQGKYINIVVKPNGTVLVGNDTLQIDKVAAEVQQRLWKSYLGTGKMYDGISIVMDGEVLMGVRGSALDAIRQGQEKALTELCVSKYEKEYKDLSPSQQDKLKRKFPVLFQELKW